MKKRKPLTAKQKVAQHQRDRIYRAEWRRKNPIIYHFQRLYWRSKQRNKRCVITLEEFTKFCQDTGYHLYAGPGKYDMTIDCVVDVIGYEYGNIRPMSRSDNAQRERFRQLDREWTPQQWKPVEDIESF